MDLHHSTAEISTIVLTARRDVVVAIRDSGRATEYVLEDSTNGRFFRIGYAEYTLFTLFDGRRTFADVLGQAASLLQEQAPAESEAAAFCRWLVENQLAQTAASASSWRLLQSQEKSKRKQTLQRLNPIFIRMPLFNPDRAVRVAADLVGWIFSAPMVLLWLATVATALLTVAMNWSLISSGGIAVVQQENWLWLSATWLLLRLVHELAHGVVCRRYGGNVREAGILWLLFVPLPYVDVSSAWRFDSRWKRMAVSAAGMYAELFIAALAALLWARVDDPAVRQHAFNVMVSGSVVTLLFNCNPLMKFDGYYILIDWLAMPNLATHGQQQLRTLGRRFFFGVLWSTQHNRSDRPALVLLYGIAAFVWRILVCVGIVLTADLMFFGAGLVLAVVAIVLWVLIPVLRLVLYIVRGTPTEQPDRMRFAIVSVTLIGISALIWTRVPYYARHEAPAVVSYASTTEVRAAADGFVEQIAVSNGDHVAAGTALVRLRNPSLVTRVRQLELLHHESRQRAQQYLAARLIAAWQAETANTQSLLEQLQEGRQQLQNLIITAPHEGEILTSETENLRGQYVRRGDLVLSLGRSGEKTVFALVAPAEADAFSERLDQPLSVSITGQQLRRWPGHLRSMSPRASTEVVLPQLAATSNGPIGVQLDESADRPGQTTERFLEPQLKAEVHIDSPEIQELLAGRTGTVFFHTDQRSVGQVLMQSSNRWIQNYRTALINRWWY